MQVHTSAFLGAALAVLATAPASAQIDDRPTRQPNMSCQNWNAQIRGGVPQVMRQLVGVWRSETVIPAVPGLMDATPEQMTTTLYSAGTLLYEKSACFNPPPPPPGLPPLQRQCAKAIGQGGWFARPAERGWIFVGVLMQGSSYTGEITPPNCAGVQVRFTGPNSIVNEYGTPEERIGQAQ